jgi:hypothetical protein
MIPNGAWRVLSRRLPVIPPLARALRADPEQGNPPLARAPRADPEQGNFMIADSFGRRYPVGNCP